jgi:carboxylate-amine ligase
VSEDFGWYLDQADGALFLLGCAETDAHPDLHTPEFDLDERVLLTAVDIFHALTLAGT